eukprot:GHRR01029898.1.p2 GENE.GHRR01029898.1~~GHRR01029898.1.p2  ORF type:complete len:109 (-),score=13.90 GHRR01029898.1:540-866(-)
MAAVEQPRAETGFYCSTSGTYFLDKESLAEHYKSDFHRYNLKRKVRARACGPQQQLLQLPARQLAYACSMHAAWPLLMPACSQNLCPLHVPLITACVSGSVMGLFVHE